MLGILLLRALLGAVAGAVEQDDQGSRAAGRRRGLGLCQGGRDERQQHQHQRDRTEGDSQSHAILRAPVKPRPERNALWTFIYAHASIALYLKSCHTFFLEDKDPAQRASLPNPVCPPPSLLADLYFRHERIRRRPA